MKPDAVQDNGFYVTGWILIGGAAAYAVFVMMIGFNPLEWMPPCAFYAITGYYCPGCGGTRAVFALLHGHILRSVLYHPIVLYTAILGGWFMISQTIERFSKGRVKIGMHFRTIYLWLALALVVVHFIIKNILVYNGSDILNILGTELSGA